MNTSKLEIYVGIAEALHRNGPLETPEIEKETGIESILALKCLDFLVGQGIIVRKTKNKNSAIYEITQRGINVIKFFK